jgi:hypothetical protein
MAWLIVSNQYALAESGHVSGLGETGRSHPYSKPPAFKRGFMTYASNGAGAGATSIRFVIFFHASSALILPHLPRYQQTTGNAPPLCRGMARMCGSKRLSTFSSEATFLP